MLPSPWGRRSRTTAIIRGNHRHHKTARPDFFGGVFLNDDALATDRDPAWERGRDKPF
ncbi:hypothetical protein MTBUT4_90150 [Magnetospirillum sp. UT-4]|nr:hypothetical protein MTBUT4_90150 [Magnetospirillum sp. UT-4]